MKSAERMRGVRTLNDAHETEETLIIYKEEMTDVPICIDMFFLLLDLADIKLGHEVQEKSKKEHGKNMNIKNFCDSCQHSEKRAKEMPCSICLQVGLRWKEPVFYCQEGKEEGDRGKRSE